jgi:ketosteroid isomerase-like protein
MKANNLGAVMKCYAKDSVVWAPGEAEAKGSEAIRAMFGRLLDANTVKDASISDGHYQTVGSRSVGWGKFSLTLQPKSGGSPVTMTGRFTEVGERRDGRWVYMVDHASADPPPSEAK